MLAIPNTAGWSIVPVKTVGKRAETAIREHLAMTDGTLRRAAYHQAGRAVIAAMIGCPLETTAIAKGKRTKFGPPVQEALVNVVGVLAEVKTGLDFNPATAGTPFEAAEKLLKNTAENLEHLSEVARCLLRIAKVDEAVREIADRLLAGRDLTPDEIEVVCLGHALPLAESGYQY
jgi:hypothetical protein